MPNDAPIGLTLRDLPDLRDLAVEIRDHLLLPEVFFDFGSMEEPTPDRALTQLVFTVNRQNYISLLGALETDHVILAAQLARSLLEESIRWEWMTDEPETRMSTLVGELRRNLRNIEEECHHLGAECAAFLNPSPFWNTDSLKPFDGSHGFPGIEKMLTDIDTKGEEKLLEAGAIEGFKIRRALYAQYRVLSQLTHLSVLGMTSTMQWAADGSVAVGTSLPNPHLALVIHTASASAVNVAGYTVSSLVETPKHAKDLFAWILAANALVFRMAEIAGPMHGLTP